ncbi:MAG: 30S ribosomal protein S16 [bacterium]|nr:30S ribosomal protein S16 [bacterium]
MLAIKLQRIGKKHQPSYRVVVAEKRSKLNGPPVEDLGSYNPATKQLNVAKERVEHWLKVSATPTTTVHNLLVKNGIVSGKKIAVKMKKAVIAEGGSPLVQQGEAAGKKATEMEAKAVEPAAEKTESDEVVAT